MLDSPKGVVIAIRARKDDDAKFHVASDIFGIVFSLARNFAVYVCGSLVLDVPSRVAKARKCS
jgi:hypothetical protein